MSGGVDSSVTAALLKQQGYDVTGVYMKNWSQDLPGMVCPWKDDYQDAKRVAVRLGIPFKMYDFETEYRGKVVDYMIDEYKAGRTPNPDIMCNQEIKFKLFLETALEDGADLIATGHYSRIENAASRKSNSPTVQKSSEAQLLVARNMNKDQTYFLYRVTEEALSRSLMPLGEFASKTEVRELARKFGLTTAEKKDSQGICFVGKVGIRDFLSQYVPRVRPGAIVDQNGREVGQHDGAIFYTIGQRHGLNIGGGLPYYVTGKDMAKNEVYVTTNLDDENLWKEELLLMDPHWINQPPDTNGVYHIRTRHRAPLTKAKLAKFPSGRGQAPNRGEKIQILLDEPVRAVTSGQSAVLYDGEQVIGGGIIV